MKLDILISKKILKNLTQLRFQKLLDVIVSTNKMILLSERPLVQVLLLLELVNF